MVSKRAEDEIRSAGNFPNETAACSPSGRSDGCGVTAVGPPSLNDVASLLDAGLVDSADAAQLNKVADNFHVAVTPHLGRMIATGDNDAALAAQFVPSVDELTVLPHERHDPIGDDAYEVVKGVTHRYPDRVLLKLTHICRVYCRFCFRREKVGDPGYHLTAGELRQAIDYIANDPCIWEVILTGGDPLVLSNRRLANVMNRLASIDHLGVIRLHTRVPIAEPKRVDNGLLAALKTKKAVFLVIHCNHPGELSGEVCAALGAFVDAGIPVLSQTVLLRGINDTKEVLEQLMRKLVSLRVKPYYLHHPDLARGTGHFRVSIEHGVELVDSLRGFVSGVCQPTYVLDIPGGYGKVPLTPCYTEQAGNGGLLVRDYRGAKHEYLDPIPNPARRRSQRRRCETIGAVPASSSERIAASRDTRDQNL
jgi:lysine 2,3-aminomutase